MVVCTMHDVLIRAKRLQYDGDATDTPHTTISLAGACSLWAWGSAAMGCSGANLKADALVISSTLLCGILLLGDNSYVNWNVFELCKFSLVHLFHLLSYTELLEGRDHILFIFGFSELIIMPFGTLMFTEWRNSCLTINHLRTQIMFLFKEVFCISPQCTGQYPIQGSTQWVVY